MFSTPSLPLSPLQLAKKRTKEAAIIGYFSAGFTSVWSVGLAFSQSSATPLGFLPDAALVAGLAYGVHKRSRICAAVLVAYWVLAKWLTWQETPPGFFGIFIAFAFWLSFIRGFLGAVSYHRKKEEPNQAPQPNAGTVPFADEALPPRG